MALVRAYMAAKHTRFVQMTGDQAMRLASEVEDAGAEISVANMVTGYLLQQELAKRALTYAERGLAIACAKEDWQWQLTMQSHLAAAHILLEQWDSALARFRAALTLAANLQDESAQARIHGRIGAVLAEMDQLPAAIAATEQALALAQSCGDLRLVANNRHF